jgi:hypothetical protein
VHHSPLPNLESYLHESADSLVPPQSVCNSDDVLSVVSRYSNVPCWVLVDVSYTYGVELAFSLVRYET